MKTFSCPGFLRLLTWLSPFFLILACTSPRVEKYNDLLEPLVGNASRQEVDAALGNPVLCETKRGLQVCEYQTSVKQNDPVPAGFRPTPGFQIVPKPYDYFDVLRLSFDSSGILVDWTPVVISEQP